MNRRTLLFVAALALATAVSGAGIWHARKEVRRPNGSGGRRGYVSGAGSAEHGYCGRRERHDLDNYDARRQKKCGPTRT